MRLSNLQLILMSQVNQNQLTGYQLSKILPEKGWRVSHQQIYRDLDKLKLSGLVSLEIVPQRSKPDRKLYLLTTTGREQLVKAYAAEPALIRNQDEVLVHLFLGNVPYFEKLVVQLSSALDTALNSSLSQSDLNELPIRLATDREIQHLDAEIAWVKQVLIELYSEADSKAA